MSGDEMTPKDEVMQELSDEELEDVSGGLSFQFTAARVRKSSFSSSGEASLRSLRNRAPQPSIQEDSIESALIQLTVVDATTEDLKLFIDLLGDASAIEGSD